MSLLESMVTRTQRERRPSLWRSALARRISGRLLGGVLVLWAAVSLAFLGVHLAPGDIVSLLIGEQVRTPAIEAAIRAEWGLNDPLWLQYLNYLWRVLHGEFGRSYIPRLEEHTSAF